MASPNNRGGTDQELLSAYMDDELNYVQRTALEARLKREPDLRRELEDLRVVVAAVRSLPPVKAPRSFALTPDMLIDETAAPQLEREAASFLFFPTTAAFSALSAAAAVLLLVFGGLLLLIALEQPAPAAFDAMPADNVLQQQPPPQGGIALVATGTATHTPTRASAFSSTVLPLMTIVPPTPSPAPTETPTPLPSPSLGQGEGADGPQLDDDSADEVAAEPTALGDAEAESDTFAADGAEPALAEEAAEQAEEAEEAGAQTAPQVASTEEALIASATNVPTQDPTATLTAQRQLPVPTQTQVSGGGASRLVPTGTIIARVLPTTAARTVNPPAQPADAAPSTDFVSIVSLVLIVLGIGLLGVSAGTTIARRRSKRRGTA